MRTDLHAVTLTVHYGLVRSYPQPESGWSASVHWIDSRWCQPGTIEGDIRTRYHSQTLPEAIDVVMEVAEQFGLKPMPMFSLCYQGDGEEPGDTPPVGWRNMLRAESEKRGWQMVYQSDEAVAAKALASLEKNVAEIFGN